MNFVERIKKEKPIENIKDLLNEALQVPRYFWYLVSFPVVAFLYIAFHQFFLADTIATAVFFLGTFGFVFAREEMPEKKLDIPAVHYYHKSRINTYGYIVAGSFIFTAFLFAITSQILWLRPGVVALLCWFFMIVAALIALRYTQENLEREIITDYIAMKLKADKALFDKIDLVVKKLLELTENEKFDEKNASDSLSKSFKDKDGFEEDLMKKVIRSFFEYVKGTQEKLVSEEIEFVNEI